MSNVSGNRKPRLTRQKKLILEQLVADKSHPSADELHSRIRNGLLNISLGTVYRNLDQFCRTGKALRLDYGPAPVRYDGCTKPHDHARCVDCGGVWDVGEALAAKLEVPAEVEGMKIIGYRLEYLGRCAACQAQA